MMLVSPVPVPCNQVVPAADLEAAVPALVEHALVAELVHLAHERVEVLVRRQATDRVLVRDLGHRLREPPERGRDEAAGVVGRVPARVAPQASNTSRRMEIDHTIPYAECAPSGIGNYGPMTRRHHRINTHDHWDVRQPWPGIYLWRDPYGTHYLVDHTGTRRLNGP
jgi:hypothetical protein